MILYYNKYLRLIIVCITIAILSFSFSYVSSDNHLNYYLKNQIIAKNDTSFLINNKNIEHIFKEKNKYTLVKNAFIGNNDIVETTEKDIVIIFNDFSSVKIQPFSKVIFINSGEHLSLKMIQGEIEVQTIYNASIFSQGNLINLRQGGVKIQQKENFSKIASYYGSSEIDIYYQDKFVMSYVLPIKKSITIHQDINKNNWKQIRYSKLNKELFLSNVKDEIVKRIFRPQEKDLLKNQSQTLFLQFRKFLSISPNGKKYIKNGEIIKNIKQVMTSIETQDPDKITNSISKLKKWQDSPIVIKLPSIIPNISSPIIKYYTESAFDKIFKKNHNSINNEIKYLYNIWENHDQQSENLLIQEINNKINKYKHNLNKLEESYNLITSLIEVYPQFVSENIVKCKYLIETLLYELSKNKTEKIDTILYTFDKNLKIIVDLIENNNGNIARNIYNNMFINSNEIKDPFIHEYRKEIFVLEKEVQSLLNFYDEKLKLAAFNENIFETYKENKEKEKKAVATFRKNIQKFRARPQKTDFSKIVEIFEKNSIQLKTTNISYAIDSGSLLFIENLNFQDEPQIIFNCVYDVDNQKISQITWNKNKFMPPLKNGLTISEFVQEYQNISQEIKNKKDQSPAPQTIIYDWIETIAHKNLQFNLEKQIKKRLTKEKLHQYQIDAQESKMKIFENIVEITNALIQEDRTKIIFDLRLNTDNWTVLSLQLKDFPLNKMRVSSLENLRNTIIQKYHLIQEKQQMKKNLQSDFKFLTKDLIEINKIKIIDQEKGLLSFDNIYFFIPDQNDKENKIQVTWGEYFLEKKLFKKCQIKFNGKTKTFNNILIKNIKTKIRNFAFPKIVKKPPKRKNEIKDEKEAQTIIEKALTEIEPKTEKENKTIEILEEFLDDGAWL